VIGQQSIPGEPGLLADLRLVVHQTRYELASFWRNPQSRFFTVLLPVIFLLIFVAVFGNHTTPIGGGVRIKTSTYYVPGIVALGIISASFVNLVITITAQREQSVLKRRRATPVPAWVLIAGRAVTSIVVSAAIVIVLIGLGRIAFGVRVPTTTIAGIAIATVVGSISFCCLGYALCSFIRSADAAQPIVQALILPLYFISGVFVPDHTIPSWLRHVADVFPVRHLAQALLTAFNPATSGAGIAGKHLLVLAAWGAAGLIVALRRFSWVPRAGGS
jgi:ABC-2 type transport system permease protein